MQQIINWQKTQEKVFNQKIKSEMWVGKKIRSLGKGTLIL